MKKIIPLLIGLFCLQMGIAQVKKTTTSKKKTVKKVQPVYNQGTPVDRSKRPKPGPAPVITLKDPVIYNLPNGITLLVVENHKLPKVRASFFVDYGPVFEGEKAGTLDLVGSMLGEGTTQMPKDKFDEAVDILGADVNFSASGASASALTRYFEKAFSLMAEGLQHPAFTQESFDKLKSMTITGLKTEEKSTPQIASRVYKALSYGKQTAQGEFTTEESVKNISLDDVKVSYKNFITPSRSYLTFVGDITAANAKALTEKYLGKWDGKKLPVPTAPKAENPAKTEIDFINIPTAVQAEIRVGNIVNNPLSNPDYHALLLANYILGGGAESKLFMNLREKHGFTYGSYSSVGNGRFPALFTATAAVRTEKVDSASSEIFKEILAMRDGKVTAENLANAKALYNGSFALGMEDPAKTATYASNILINGLEKDFYRTFLQKINAVTLDDIKRVSAKYFSENNSRILIAGNADKIIPGLLKYGFPIKKYDRFANPVVEEVKEVKADPSVKTTDKISAFDIVDSFLKAIGGKEELKKTNSSLTILSMDVVGRSFDGTEKKMLPNSTAMELKMGTMTIFKQVFNGTSGYQQRGPQKKDLDEEETKELKDEKGIFPQLSYLSSDYKLDYLGSGNYNNEATYRLKVVMPSGKTSIQQYSIKSGLLLQEEATTADGKVETTVYNDYRKAGNFTVPFELIKNRDEQEVTFKVTDIKFNEGVSSQDFQ